MLWRLAASPRWWPAWAPHLREVHGVEGDPAPRALAPGQRLTVHSVVPGVAVSATITRVEPPHRWDFAVALPGPWRLHSAHLVTPGAAGSRIAVVLWLEGPARGLGGAWGPLRAYQPVAAWAVRRLAALAAAEARSA